MPIVTTPLFELFVLDADSIVPEEIEKEIQEDLNLKLKIHRGLAELVGIRATRTYLEKDNEYLATAESAGQLFEDSCSLQKQEDIVKAEQVKLNLEVQKRYAEGKWVYATPSACGTFLRSGFLLPAQKLYAVRKR